MAVVRFNDGTAARAGMRPQSERDGRQAVQLLGVVQTRNGRRLLFASADLGGLWEPSTTTTPPPPPVQRGDSRARDVVWSVTGPAARRSGPPLSAADGLRAHKDSWAKRAGGTTGLELDVGRRAA